MASSSNRHGGAATTSTARASAPLGRELDGRLFARQRDLLELAVALRACLVAERIEGGVVVERLMVEQLQPARPGAVGERHGVREAGVAPADVVAVLTVGVLRVVDQQVGVSRQVD